MQFGEWEWGMGGGEWGVGSGGIEEGDEKTLHVTSLQLQKTIKFLN
jgi:hypothetical protein